MGLLANWLEKRIELSDVEQASLVFNLQERLSSRALAFYIAKSYVTETLSRCEIKRFINGKEEKDTLYYLLNVSPNVNDNAFQLKTKFYNKLFIDGEALMFEHKGSLYVADSYIRDIRPIKGDLFTNISIDGETQTFKRKAEDVFFLELGENDKIKSLIDGMMDDYSELLKYSFNTHQTSNNEKYKLILDEVKVGDKDFQEKFNKVIKKQIEAFVNNPKAVYLQFKGQNLEQMQQPDGKTDSTDYRNIRKEMFEITAEAFKIPVSLMYGNMTNVNDIVKSFITFAISPRAKVTEEEFTRKTGSVDDYLKGTYFKVDTSTIMYRDVFEIADKIDKAIASGVLCIDEARKKLGEDPLDTDFSKQHWMTKNYSRIEDVLDGEDTPVQESSLILDTGDQKGGG